MRFNFRRATLPDDAIAAGGCCWEKRGMAFWGNSFSVFFSVRSFIPAVADVRGFLQEDDGGGDGIRYTVMIRGKESFLFHEGDKWFVEAKESS